MWLLDDHGKTYQPPQEPNTLEIHNLTFVKPFAECIQGLTEFFHGTCFEMSQLQKKQ